MLNQKHVTMGFLIMVVLTAYQNCGQVEITPQPTTLSLSTPEIKGNFCETRLSVNSPEWSLRKFLIVNMTAVYDLNGKLLSNDQSLSMQQLSGGAPLVTNLSAVNSDSDFLPDFLENYFGTDSTRDDMGWDYTGESKVVENSIQRGLNPRVLTARQDHDIVSYNYQKLSILELAEQGKQACLDGGDMWSFHFSEYLSVPVIKSSATLQEPAYSHEKDENVFLLLVISENSAGEYKYSYKVLKIVHKMPNPSLMITPDMFTDIQ